jgi:molybdopterin synthase sulfur carrier subunit
VPLLTIRYFAAARAAAGVETEVIEIPAADPPWSVESALCKIAKRHGPELSKVLGSCSFLLDEVAVRSLTAQLPPDGATLDVLPPFAGG